MALFWPVTSFGLAKIGDSRYERHAKTLPDFYLHVRFKLWLSDLVTSYSVCML